MSFPEHRPRENDETRVEAQYPASSIRIEGKYFSSSLFILYYVVDQITDYMYSIDFSFLFLHAEQQLLDDEGETIDGQHTIATISQKISN